MALIAPGTPVLYIIAKTEADEEGCIERFKNQFKKEGISYAEDDDKLYVKGFVAADSAELGVSVVALDNSKYCLIKKMKEGRNDIDRAQIKRGWYRRGMFRHQFGNSTCPYSG